MKERLKNERIKELETKREQRMLEALKKWRKLLPNWSNIRDHNMIKLWEIGLPPKVRGSIWMLVLKSGESIEFKALVQSALQILENQKNHSTAGIERKYVHDVKSLEIDIAKTLPELNLFQVSCPMYDDLKEVLLATALSLINYGYKAGMANLAAMFLLNMNKECAFDCLCRLFERNFFQIIHSSDADKNIPDLYSAFMSLELHENTLVSMYTTLFPLEISSRIWDCVFLYGEVYLFKAALGYLKLIKPKILNQSLEWIMPMLKKSLAIEENQLFEKINSIRIDDDAFCGF
ncbi:RabGAP/TBC [Rozella allomycis CSF55]|uniref:RabGAP/TBC n=1 Tax=Rozella allomycis (strain CSF55) TaxID=988480 RepID=A0A4P9YIW2_ROZAC|nr:RabGAP/TBC [Rozella allomycis CSF55]